MTDLAGANRTVTFSWSNATQADANAPYTNSGAAATLTLDAVNATTDVSEAQGAFSDGAGALALTLEGAGAFLLAGPNVFSGAVQLAGPVQVDLANAGDLGTGAIAFVSGDAGLVATGSLAISQALSVQSGASATLAAANGAIMTLNGALNFDGGSGTLLHIGSSADTGVVALAGSASAWTAAGVSIDGGTLQLAGASVATQIALLAGGITVNGTLDLDGQALTLRSLGGTGVIENTGALAHLTLAASGTFHDSFSGAIDIEIPWEICTFDGPLAVNSLAVDMSGSVTVNSSLSANSVSVDYLAGLALAGDDSQFTGTIVCSGSLVLDNAHALGNAQSVNVSGLYTDLLAKTNVAYSGTFTSADSTLEASAGATLTLAGPLTLSGGFVNIGYANLYTGTIVLGVNGAKNSSASGVGFQLYAGVLEILSSVALAGASFEFQGAGVELMLNGVSTAVAVTEASSGLAGIVDLNASEIDISGGGQTVNFASGSGDAAALINTGGSWDAAYNKNGTTGTLYLESAQAQVTGGGDVVQFTSGTGDAVDLLSTGGGWDVVTAANGTTGILYLESAEAQVWGGGETVRFWTGTGDAASLVNTGGGWDAVVGFTNQSGAPGVEGTVFLTSAQAQVTGMGETVYFWGGTGNAASLVSTAGIWDNVYEANGATGTTYLTGALAQVWGGGETIDFYTGYGSAAHLIDTAGAWDTIVSENNAVGTVYLDSAQAELYGSGQTVYFWGGSGNQLVVNNTNGGQDVVAGAYGQNGTTFLNNASVQLYGNLETLDIWSGTANYATLSGYSDAVIVSQATFGTIRMSGFDASDTLYLPVADQGKISIGPSDYGFSEMLTLDANDTINLGGYRSGVNIVYR